MSSPAPPSPWAQFLLPGSSTSPAPVASTSKPAEKLQIKIKLKMRHHKSSTPSSSPSTSSPGQEAAGIPSDNSNTSSFANTQSSNTLGSSTPDSGYGSGSTITDSNSPKQSNDLIHSNGMKRSLGMYDDDELPNQDPKLQAKQKVNINGKVENTAHWSLSPLPFPDASASDRIKPCLWEQLPIIDPGTKILSDPFAADRARGVRFIKIDEDIDPLAPNPKVKFRVRLPANELDEKLQIWLDWKAGRRVTRGSTNFIFHGNSAKTRAEKFKVKKRSTIKPFYKR